MQIRKHRFPSGNLKQIEPLKSNVYINPADPHYYEKILQYVDAHSCKAHYYVGKKYLERGNRDQALYHLRRSAEGQDSFARLAQAAIAEIGKTSESVPSPTETVEPSSPRSKLILYVAISGFLLLLLLLLLGTLHPSVRAVVSQYVSDTVGMHVVYEAGERPFYLYFDASQSTRVIEQTLYDKALEMGKQYPRDKIVLYGLYGTGDDVKLSRAYPVAVTSVIEHAFVTAQFHAQSDSHVHIRFIHPQVEKEADEQRARIQTAANIIRTALSQYQKEHGVYPNSLETLAGEYPNNYLSYVPQVPSESVAFQHNPPSIEGWLYEPTAERLEDVLQPEGYSNVPFVPMELFIVKGEHKLLLVNGNYILHQTEVGLGRDDRTPIGQFVVDQRVRQPEGREPGVYGAAALGFGAYAIHGTNEPASIGANDSLGCVRLINDEMDAIFSYVPSGAHIRIVDAMPDTPQLLAAGSLPTMPSIYRAGETAEGQVFSWLL